MRVAFNHSSVASADDRVDQRIAHVEEARNVGDCFSSGAQFSHPDYISVADFWFGSGVKVEALGVPYVLGDAYPFKIGEDVIGFDRINVVDDWKIERVWDERLSYQAMHAQPFNFSVQAQDDVQVSVLASGLHEALLHDVSRTSVRGTVLVDRNSIDAPDPTDIADFVQSFESSNAPPFFINHLMDLSEKAHFIVASSATQGG